MAGISAVVITFNAAKHLDAVLRSLAVCDEIVVLDSGSTDLTREIAHSHKVVWSEHAFDDYGRQKIRACQLAKHDWILNVDADEILDTLAQDAIREMDWSLADSKTCWQINRRPFVGRREVCHGHWVPDRLLRVFNRLHHQFSTHPIHPTVAPSGPVRTLKGSLKHYCYEDYASVFRTDYHRMKAQLYRKNQRSAGGPTLALRGCWAFFYSYVMRRGFLDGRLGVITATAGMLNAVLGLALASEPEE